MSQPPDLPNLHDAILESIEIDWEEGSARCMLQSWVGRPLADPGAEMRPLTIALEGIQEVTIPRAQPWGPSVYVNGARLTRQDGVEELVIEMQSGDEVVVRAGKIHVVTDDEEH